MTPIIIIILALVLLGLMLILSDNAAKKRAQKKILDKENFRIDVLCDACREEINHVLNEDYKEFNLNKEETHKRELQQARLRRATRDACLGDSGDREYLKGYIKEVLEKKLGVSATTINGIIPFTNSDAMTAQDKFEHMYTIYKKTEPFKTFKKIVEDFDLLKPKFTEDGREYCCVTADDISEAYDNMDDLGDYNDKFDTVVQRVYEIMYGNDCADLLVSDASIDGVQGGTGGRTRIEYNFFREIDNLDRDEEEEAVSNYYDIVYVVFHGRLTRMKFLSFGKPETLERVVKNIYRYNSKTTLSQKTPELHGTMKNGSRIVVSRPPVGDAWRFYVRNFGSSDARSIYNLITHENREIVINLLYAIITGELNATISGGMGSGKTTLLKSLVGWLNPQFAVRVAETAFELNLSNLYPERNIASMQERENYSIYQILADIKKMDADVVIVGEVNEPRIAGAYIQVGQTASKMALTTLHHETTRKLIDYLRNGLVSEEGLDSDVAEHQVIEVLNFDIHQKKDIHGNFFIERITEVIPAEEYEPYPDRLDEAQKEYYRRSTDRHAYSLQNIIEFDTENMRYRVVGNISPYTQAKMAQNAGWTLVNDIVAQLQEQLGA